ncbi:MAG TPA: VCBS repeat-containing protein, partial [Chloroflexota bacterium]|nr:VCBS repeat-containing protein [Chloroflexota bacterium]
TFRPARTQTVWSSSGGDALAVGSFAGNGVPYLAAANFGLGQVMILKSNGDGSFSREGSYTVGAGPEGLAVGDFNGDHRLDIAVDDLNDGGVAMLLGRGNGAFVPAASSSTGRPMPFGWAAYGYPTFLATGDLSGRGLPDIVTGNLLNATITVLKNSTR